MNISFVLVEPQYPENIGSVARALNTMGFSDLRLVNPVDHLCDNAKWLAHGSIALLEKAGVYSEFDESVSDADIIIGTSAKKRKTTYNYINASDLKKFITDKQNPGLKVSVVFGNEDRGLPNEILKKCQLISYIPLASKHPSLNLSQAVMIYAYLLNGITEMPVRKSPKKHSLALSDLRERINIMLQKTGEDAESNFIQRLNERLSDLNDKDVKMIYYILKKLEEKFNL